MSRDKAILVDLLKAARLVLQFKGKLSKRAFLRDGQNTVRDLALIVVIGEAVKRLSDSFRAEHNELPWPAIAGMRDKLIHQYDAVDLNEVWKTVTTDIEPLIVFLEKFVSSENE